MPPSDLDRTRSGLATRLVVSVAVLSVGCRSSPFAPSSAIVAVFVAIEVPAGSDASTLTANVVWPDAPAVMPPTVKVQWVPAVAPPEQDQPLLLPPALKTVFAG